MALRPKIDNRNWPETVTAAPDTFLGAAGQRMDRIEGVPRVEAA
jgi:hypothetical protein